MTTENVTYTEIIKSKRNNYNIIVGEPQIVYEWFCFIHSILFPFLEVLITNVITWK